MLHVTEHIAWVEAAIKWYRIKGPTSLMNVDESGIYFKNLDGRCARQGIGPEFKALLCSLV